MDRSYVVCVDDDGGVLQGLRQELSMLQKKFPHLRIEIADSGEDGLEIIDDLLANGHALPLVISDQLMPGLKGDELLRQVHIRSPQTKKILLTGQTGVEAVGRAVNFANLYRYIAKPWEPEDLLMTVEQAIKSYLVDKRLEASMRALNDINLYAVRLGAKVRFLPWVETLMQNILPDSNATAGLLCVRFENAEAPFFIGARYTPETGVRLVEIEKPESFLPPAVFEQTQNPSPQSFVWNEGRASYLAHFLKENKWLGYLYLENEKTPDIFDEDGQSFLNALTGILPISLDNAILYENLESKVAERTRVIEDINKDLTDSITYARRIQFAILPEARLLDEAFPENFIFYQPKDIVSGDFYWFAREGNYFFVSAVDCTGHGVPGAFMSVLANSYLNAVVKELKIFNVSDILYSLNQKILDTLQKNNPDGAVQDGMDLALCRIDLTNFQVQYGGANRPIWSVQGGAWVEYKPNKAGVGGTVIAGGGDENRFYKAEEFQLSPGDALYLFTDGIADQFGGDKNKKFSVSRLQETLFENRAMSMKDQYARLSGRFEEWRGALTQTDDVLVFGLRRDA